MSYRPRVCLDTSVVVKWFKIEENSESAIELKRLAETSRIKLAISAIVFSDDEHHFKESLKSYFTDKNVRLLKLSEVGRIPF